MSHVRIEPATTEDVDDLVDAWVALAETQRRHGSHLAAEANREAIRPVLAFHAVNGSVYVAREEPSGDAAATEGAAEADVPGRAPDAPIAGFVNFGIEEAGLEGDAVRGIVHNVYVEPAARDSGVGGALLDAAEAALVERGADVIAIEAIADNEAARRLYERRGYRPHRVQYERTAGTESSAGEATETDTSPSE